ncbi:MAG: hypothetical protein ACYDAQ_01365 [Mycobacteriales bacterium]
MTGAFTGVLFGKGIEIVANCSAVTTPPVGLLVIATVINECYLTTGGGNHPVGDPGNASTETFVANVPTVPLLCVSAYSILSNGTDGRPASKCVPAIGTAGGVAGVGEGSS